MPTSTVRSKLFWSGGSQAVRLPKDMRLPGSEVTVTRKGKALVITPAPVDDSWDGFWDAFEADPDLGLQRWPTGPAEIREPL